MSNEELLIKSEFDYYTDNYYSKLFSAFDMIGHLLNSKFDLGLESKGKEINFVNAIKEIGGNDSLKHIYDSLVKIKGSHIFQKAKKYRLDIIHNFPPYKIGPGYKEQKNAIGFGGGEYVTSEKLKYNAEKSLDLLSDILNIIKNI